MKYSQIIFLSCVIALASCNNSNSGKSKTSDKNSPSLPQMVENNNDSIVKNTNSGKIDVNSIKEKDIEAKAYFKLLSTDNKGHKYIKKDVDFEYPTSIPGFKVDEIQKNVIAWVFGRKYKTLNEALASVNKYNNATLVKSFPDDVKDHLIKDIEIEGNITDLNYDILSYNVDTEKGSDNEISKYYNFDLQQNKEITYSDVFTQSKSKQLIALIENEMKGERKDFSKISQPDNFYLSEGTINFVFMPHEIASDNQFTIVVNFPLSSLKDYFTPKYSKRFGF